MKFIVAVSLFAVGCADPGEATSTGLPRPSTIPEWAVEISPDVFSLGSDVDPETGDAIEGIAFVDREPGMVPEELLDMGRRVRSCYALEGFGSWPSPESWGYDATNSSGISASSLQTTITTAQGLWETASGGDIFGAYTSSYSGHANGVADGQNNVQFGDAGGTGVVAVTYIWAGGAGKTRFLTEWDQIYADSEPWTVGNPASANAFDLLNVSAHEIGHAAGVDHPSNTCTEETMYAYVDYGETKKRTLNAGDIQGISLLY
jgi:hypothetical protein